MKVQIVPAAGALVEVTLKDGKKLDNAHIKSIHIEPFFVTTTGQGEVCQAVSQAGADELEVDRAMLLASGSSGKTSIFRRKKAQEKSAIPLIDRKRPVAAGAAT